MTFYVHKEYNVARHSQHRLEFFANLPEQKELRKDAYFKLKDRNI